MELSDLFSNLALGFSVAATPGNLFWCLMGALVGTAIGVLPGVGPVATMALLLPTTYYLPPEGALIMLAGIYYGAQYGGSTTAILINLPGESSSVVTVLDGYQMAKQGRAGAALAIAAIGSFFAGCVATVAIAVAAPPFTETLRHGVTGYLYADPRTDSGADFERVLTGIRSGALVPDRAAAALHLEQFAFPRFADRIHGVLREITVGTGRKMPPAVRD